MSNIEIKFKEYSATCEKFNAKLVVVTKNQTDENVREVYRSGGRVFGENKVQDLLQKSELFPSDVEWHLIGHLQTNKVKSVVPFVSMIHSVDSEKLLIEINKRAKLINKTINCLLQVHIAKEETKFGFLKDELLNFLNSDTIEDYKNIKIVGIMGMATNTDDQNQVRTEFKELKSIFEEIKNSKKSTIEITQLSMGMTNDYLIALEEGSTMVRVGSGIFFNR